MFRFAIGGRGSAAKIVEIESALSPFYIRQVATDNYVGLAAIAERTGLTHETTRRYATGERGPGHFPLPVTGVESHLRIWRWSEVLDWFLLNPGLSKRALTVGAIPKRELAAINAILAARHLVRHLREGSQEELRRLCCALMNC